MNQDIIDYLKQGYREQEMLDSLLSLNVNIPEERAKIAKLQSDMKAYRSILADVLAVKGQQERIANIKNKKEQESKRLQKELVNKNLL